MANLIIILPIILPLFTFFVIIPPTICFNNETDLLSLLAFKSAIDFDPQEALISWTETTHFCRWNGVQCGHRHPDRVVGINLTSQGLVGSLSPHLGNLSLLKTISLINNNFHGLIPQQIVLLTKLEFIDFTNNSFIGSIPQNLSQCSGLVYLNLFGNSLSGFISPELGLLHELEFLDLSKNNLSGPIPPSLGNLTSLTQISLGSCKFHGPIPESFSRLQSLTFLELGDNNLVGNIPIGLFNLSQLFLLGVDTNKLQGTVPSNIGSTLPNLSFLVLAQNNFTGELPVSLSNLSYMEEFVLSLNQFTGKIPQVGGFTNLVDFQIALNRIQDDTSFISSLTNCTNLESIDVSRNMITGSLPNSISNLSVQLSNLYLQRNQIHGNIPASIGKLVGLTAITVLGNYLEGSIPESIGQLSSLQILAARNNRLSESLPSSLGNLTLLNRLYLDVNRFSGNLPSSLGNCSNLAELGLSHNNFNGFIPPQVMGLSSVSVIFNLSHNQFEGSIPYEVGSLTSLESLDLSNNRFSGAIPDSLSQCLSLEQLQLEENLLEGEIPSGLSNLVGLQVLDLSRNNLSGPIPSFLENLKLEKLNLSFNILNGEVPVEGIFMNKTAISLDGNKDLCGGIAELNLPPCSMVKSQKKNVSTFLKILIVVLVAGGIGFILLAFFMYRRRSSKKNVTPALHEFTGVQIMRLPYADLLKATDGFSETNLVGVGKFGSVYKGILDDGETEVAVKVLNLSVRGASKSLMAECNALRNLRHRNLLKILSVCESIDFQGNDFKALIYEFKANGSLEEWLYHSREEELQNVETNNLNMSQRLNIAIDIAQGLEYLHLGTDLSIVHGDLKPSNILLDHDMIAYVGDFGLAKIISSPPHESSSSIGIRGTLGYVAPEYAIDNLVSTLGDVYSYGILILEMFTNKRPTGEEFQDHVNLHGYVSNALQEQIDEIVDQRILVESNENGKVKDCIASILRIGIACSRMVPRDRMLITDVVRDLCKIYKSSLFILKVEPAGFFSFSFIHVKSL